MQSKSKAPDYPAGSSITRGALALFGVWTVIALITLGQYYVYGTWAPDESMMKEEISWSHNTFWAFLQAYVWAPLSVMVFWIARRLPWEVNRAGRIVALHIIAAFALSVVQMAVSLAIENVTPYRHQGFQMSAGLALLSKGFHVNLLFYAVLVMLAYARDYYRKYQSREIRSARLETELAQARLDTLRTQLHPHFLFNTLNAISSLVHDDPRAADRMISRLSELLRSTLDSSGEQELPLRQELELVAPYLEIERTRFRDRLTITVDVEPALLDIRVPNLLLQPLVENAVKYGTVNHPGKHRIEIRARRHAGGLRIEVEDDGPGLPAAHVEGIGLGNTRARLRHLYGSAHRLELLKGEKLGGLLVSLTIPERGDFDGNGVNEV